MVPNKHNALKLLLWLLAINNARRLQDKWDKILDFGYLRCFFHDHIVVVETQASNLLPSHCRVGRRHSNDSSFFDQEVI